MVSIKSPSSLKYGIIKIFLIRFSRASYRGLNVCEYYTDLRSFYSHFPEFLPKISSILLKDVKILNNSFVDFIFKDTKFFLIILLYFFAEISAKYFKV